MSWAQSFGWKKKANQLSGVLLSFAHQMAKELAPAFEKILDLYRELDLNKGRGEAYQSDFQKRMDQCASTLTDADRPLWEPIEIHGWKIEATLYLKNGQHWWLLHAVRKRETSPSDNDLVFLNKVLEHLGCDPERNMIIGPKTKAWAAMADDDAHEERRAHGRDDHMPFGWWTWCNRAPLFEVQVNKDKKNKKDMLRFVPLGTPEADGYVRMPSIDPNEGKG
jgi:hypothetical protein